MVEAERKLFRKALQDPLNKMFVLLSDTSIPLYSAAAIYLQLVLEKKSRINACKNDSDPNDWQQRGTPRHQGAMNGIGLTQDLWRKSSQWVSLNRHHASLAAYEEIVYPVFARECWSSPRNEPMVRFCVSDEHYIPSLLAMHGAEGDCACDGVITHTYWMVGGWHPKTYRKEDARNETMMMFRGEGACAEAGGSSSFSSSSHVLDRSALGMLRMALTEIEDDVGERGENGEIGTNGESDSHTTISSSDNTSHNTTTESHTSFGVMAPWNDTAWEVFDRVMGAAMEGNRLPVYCPLFSRKIDGDSTAEWLEVVARYVAMTSKVDGDGGERR